MRRSTLAAVTRRELERPADGPVLLLLVAHTHVPRRARDLPSELSAAVDAADVVLHAGDWVDVTLHRLPR
jgi:hypothetical protein